MVSVGFPPESVSIALSPDGRLLAAVCTIPYCVVVFDAESMHIRKQLRKQVSARKDTLRLTPSIVALLLGEDTG